MHIIIQDSGFQLAGIAVSIAPERRFPYAGLVGNPGPEYSMIQTNVLCGVLESLGKVFKQHELEYGFAEAETGVSSWIFELCCLGAVLLYIPLMALMSIKPLCRLILRGLLGKEAVRD
jgi:hypothetical protein